jgi:nucleoside-diphosphate kinase
MQGNITFSIIKPDATAAGHIGPILSMINEAGFEITALKMVRITAGQARAFYEVHREKPFYSSLVEFMSSGPVIVMILRHENAVNEFRKLIGATDPSKADPGTIRKRFATSVQMNAVHGSDSDENAIRESDFFFSKLEIF